MKFPSPQLTFRSPKSISRSKKTLPNRASQGFSKKFKTAQIQSLDPDIQRYTMCYKNTGIKNSTIANVPNPSLTLSNTS
jgi:hypothetical protein